ncbi:MAG: 50S ribosomal protein L18e, partial [Candidatus Nanoarchaeia archaeon]|nr:50S ribosomal protein L18e [Candidatus Nanoarchaeia archaeon]
FEKLYRKTKKPVFERISKELKKSARNKRSVNLSKINRYSVSGSNVLVVGKVLGSGELNHKVNVIAFSYSDSALEKLKKSGCVAKDLSDLAQDKKVPSKVIILG